MSTVPSRSAAGNHYPNRKGSYDIRNEINPEQNHYIGIDVGTGSARACIVNETGDIVGLASENIGLWQPQTGYYVRSYHWHRIWTDMCRNNLQQISGNAYVTA